MDSIPRLRLEEVSLGSYRPGILLDLDWETEHSGDPDTLSGLSVGLS